MRKHTTGDKLARAFGYSIKQPEVRLNTDLDSSITGHELVSSLPLRFPLRLIFILRCRSKVMGYYSYSNYPFSIELWISEHI